MFIGILFSVLVSLAISLFSAAAFVAYEHINPRFRSRGVFGYALFWLGMSVVWFLIAFSDFSAYLDHRSISIIAVYFFQVIVAASLIAILHFFIETLFGNRYSNILLGVYLILGALFLLNVFLYGLELRPTDFFTHQITTSPQALVIYGAMVAPLWLAGCVVFVRTIRTRKTLDERLYRFYILSCLSLILLGAVASLDEAGLIEGWILTVSRITSLVSAMGSYAAISALQEPDELVI